MFGDCSFFTPEPFENSLNNTKKVNYSKFSKEKIAITILSDNTIRLNPSQTTLGRVGFHLPKIKEFSKSVIPECVPKEIHVGEYAIKTSSSKISRT